MKQTSLVRSLIFIMLIYAADGCKKTVEPTNPSPDNLLTHDTVYTAPVIPYPITPLQECNDAPNYGDSIVFTQPANTTDFFVYPLTNQDLSGTYLSWPQGLVIDSKTGAIDLTKSETGQRYSVGFVKSGTTDTCISQLIVGGVSYMDSIYVLANSDTTSRPYFNANPYGSSPCNGSSGPGSGCQFDYNDYAKKQGIIIDKKTGYIDLKKTAKNFNLNTIWNGQSLITRIYYKLNDNSNNASQMIQVKLMYYAHKSDIPADILAQVTQNLFNTLNDLLISKGPSARPPLIVIVRQ
jgi:hypothetical protein